MYTLLTYLFVGETPISKIDQVKTKREGDWKGVREQGPYHGYSIPLTIFFLFGFNEIIPPHIFS